MQETQEKRCGFDPWVGKIPWRKKWQPNPVFLLGKSHGQKSMASYSSWGLKESDTTEGLSTHTHTHTQTHTTQFAQQYGPLMQESDFLPLVGMECPSKTCKSFGSNSFSLINFIVNLFSLHTCSLSFSPGLVLFYNNYFVILSTFSMCKQAQKYL